MSETKKWKRTKIDIFEHMNEVLQGVKKGVGLTTCVGGRTNTMAISWGMVGIEWSHPVFITLVRQGRLTHEQLEANGEFTINIATPAFKANKIVGYVGTKSGRDYSKAAELGLTMVDGEKVGVPAMAEMPLTLECRVVYKQDQDLNKMSKEMIEKFYPQDVPGNFSGGNKDVHTMYYGEIVNAYVLEEDK